MPFHSTGHADASSFDHRESSGPGASEGRKMAICVDGVRELAEGLLMLAGGKDGD